MTFLNGMQIITCVVFSFPVVVNSQQFMTPDANPAILVRPVAVELTKPYPMLLKSPSSEPQQYFQYNPLPPSNQQHQTDNTYYDMYSSLDNEYLSSDEDIPFFDYYEYGGPPDYGGGSVGGGWYGPPPPQPQPPTGGKPAKGKPKPPSSGVGGGSVGGGGGWSEGPVVSGEGDKEKDKLTELKDKWNSFIDKFKLKDKDKDKGKGKEPVKKPPAPVAPTQPPTQGGGGWGSGWGQPPIPQPPSWLGPSGGGGGGGKPILEIWLGPLWGDDPSATLEETTTLFPTSREETTTLKYNANTVKTLNNNLPSSSVLK